MALDPVKNFAIAVVDTPFNAAATSFNVAAGSGALFPNPGVDGAFNVVCWNDTDYPSIWDDPNKEVIRVTTRATDAFSVVTRAQEGTAATDKNIAGKVYKVGLFITAKMITDIDAEIAGISGASSYRATISQAGTAHPSLDAGQPMLNGLGGAVVWTRIGTGEYQGALTGAFTANKTYLHKPQFLAGAVGNEFTASLVRVDANNVKLWVTDASGFLTDQFNSCYIGIDVYP